MVKGGSRGKVHKGRSIVILDWYNKKIMLVPPIKKNSIVLLMYVFGLL